MPYTVTKLIANAYYTSGVVAREFQTVTGVQMQDGLDMLNDILGESEVNNDMIPYFTHFTFNAVAGQEEYFIPNLIEFQTLVFFLNDVRYQMTEYQMREYFGTTRAQNINTLPFTWHAQRNYQVDPATGNVTSGANLFIYFFPNINYPMEAWGLFGLKAVGINQDLALTYPPFYIAYLKYFLAKRICIEFNYEVPQGVENQLKYYDQTISKRSAQIDLKNTNISTLQTGTTLNYAIVNFGGWVV